MSTNYLFPHRYKTVSGILFVTAFILLTILYIFDDYIDFELNAKVFTISRGTGLLAYPSNWIENSVTDEILMMFVIPCGIIFAFCKEKQEDELVASIRLQSLVWATITNYTILLIGYLIVYGYAFFNVMMLAMVSQLIIFILIFRYKMYQFYKSGKNEE